jgi:hypothetical protein
VEEKGATVKDAREKLVLPHLKNEIIPDFFKQKQTKVTYSVVPHTDEQKW